MLSLPDLQQLACSLPPEDRSKLVKAILDSLANEGWRSLHPDWMREIDDRLAAFESGEIQALPADAVLEEAYKRAG